jgi:hypothetical protein
MHSPHTFPKEAPTLAHELTATRAYYLWQKAGRPEGRDWEFWFRAEREIREAYGEYLGAERHRAEAQRRGEEPRMHAGGSIT